MGYADLPEVGMLVQVSNRALGFVLVFTLPGLAFLVNVGALVFGAVKVGPRSALSMQFVKANLFSVAVVVLSTGALFFAFGHDSIACFAHGILRAGVGRLGPLIQTCARA